LKLLTVVKLAFSGGLKTKSKDLFILFPSTGVLYRGFEYRTVFLCGNCLVLTVQPSSELAASQSELPDLPDILIGMVSTIHDTCSKCGLFICKSMIISS
jgi:hypothetical protein